MTDSSPTPPPIDEVAELREQFLEILYTYNMDTTAGGMDEVKAQEYYFQAVKALVARHTAKQVEQAQLKLMALVLHETGGKFVIHDKTIVAIDDKCTVEFRDDPVRNGKVYRLSVPNIPKEEV